MKKRRKEKRRIRPLRVLGLILGGLAAALALVYIVMMLAIPGLEGVDRTPAAGSADWMAGLSDGLSLAEVVLPGSHDSGSAAVQLAFFSRCQALSVAEQLEAGIRYLDVRLAIEGEHLRFMHGFTGCTRTLAPWSAGLYLEDVLADCYAFLDAHPTETVLFAVKQERSGDSQADFARLLYAAVEREPARWLLTDTLPTVGQARGKLVLLRRGPMTTEAGVSLGLAMTWPDQPNRTGTEQHGDLVKNGSFTLWVQDRYKYDAAEKYAAFLAALAERDRGTVALNFLSTNGNVAYGHPPKYARELNRRLLAEETPLRGWIVADMVSPKLAQRIWQENFR